jgi:hypothetical protein
LWAHIEQFDGGCIRVFNDGAEYGDPPVFAFTFKRVSESTIAIVGLVGRAPKPSEGRAMLKACKEAGLLVTRERKTGRRQGWRDISRGGFVKRDTHE